jgi:hypothetical protein
MRNIARAMITVMSTEFLAAARLSIVCFYFVLSSHASAAEPPYPPSKIITAVSWDFSQTTTQRVAQGSDIWPLTWGADGELYTAWGDGGGFTGNDSRGRVSIGFGKLTGSPNDASLAGHNIWGAAPAYADLQASFGGKIQSMVSAQGVLYAYGGIWTPSNCKCADPTKLEGDGPKDGRTLAWSRDLGKTWSLARWRSGGNVYFLNFGRDNWEARDAYVYEYYLRPRDTAHIYLRRVRPDKVAVAPTKSKSREFLAAVDASTQHVRWSTHEKDATAVFFDPANVSLPQVTYNAALGRFLLTVGHNPGGTHATLSAGQLGFFEAPDPWGPWATIDYQDDWGTFGTNATGAYLGLHIPAKWISTDGSTFWAVFSNLHELDSLNLVKATLTVSDAVPRLTAPSVDTALSPGVSYSAAATGSVVEWLVELRGPRPTPVGHGAGGTFEFKVPPKAKIGQTIRVTLRSQSATVYRDFMLAPQASEPSKQP